MPRVAFVVHAPLGKPVRVRRSWLVDTSPSPIPSHSGRFNMAEDAGSGKVSPPSVGERPLSTCRGRRMALVRNFVLAVAGGLLTAASLGAQGSMGAITGRVVDSASNQPISAVTVRIEGTARGTVTRDDGTYMLGTVPVGAVRVRAARIGYAPQVQDVTVAAGAP